MPIRNSRRSSNPIFSKRKLYLAMLASSSLAFPLDSLAGPEGGRITGGSGEITTDQVQTLIEQHSDRIAIDWDSFDLDADEIVSFLQPGASSVALNRILSDSASDIRGQINANGHVVLVNPRGIVFGESAQVNVGGMLASGLDIGVDDFMNGHFAFAELEGAEGVVINRGVIEASLGGSVGLLGKSVKNEGLITAELGSVVLAAGNQAVMTFDDEGLMGVRVTESVLQDELGVDPGVLNEGVIEARGGRVLLTAAASRDVFSQAVNSGSIEQARSVVMHDDGSFTLGAGSDVVNAGAIEVGGESSAGSVTLLGENVTQGGEIFADSEHGRGGRVELTARDTTLLTRHSETQARSFSGGVGGDVLALGRQVGAEGGSLVEASGSEGGGRIYLGGDYRGKNPWLLNAEKTVVQGEAQLKANATESGDGGRIIVWADDSTRFAGHIEGKGAIDGVGGFAEVSGKQRLGYLGTAVLSGGVAPGALLLDPKSLEVVEFGSDIGGDNADGDYEVDFNDLPGSGGDVFKITAETIRTPLSQGTSVILEATDSISILEQIQFVTASSNTSLTLRSGGSISIEENIAIGNAGFVAIAGHDNCNVECGGESGNRGIELSAGRTISAGVITLESLDAINLKGQSVSGQSIDLTSRGDITVNSSLNASDGEIGINAGTDSTDIDPTGTLTITSSVETAGSDVKLSASGAVTLSDAITTQGGNVYIGSEGKKVGSFDSYGDGVENSIGSISTGGEQGSGIRNAGDIVIHSTGAVNLGNLSIAQDYFALDDNGGSESIGRIEVHSGETISLRTDFNFNNSGPFAWDGPGGMVNSEPLSMPALSFNAGGDINLRGRVYDEYVDARESLNVELRSTNGTVNLFNDIFSSGGNVTIDANRIDFLPEENGSVARIDTQNANLSQGEGDSRSDLRGGDWGSYLDGLEDGGGREHKRPSDGGHVELTAKESIDLGTVVTITQCEHFTAESCGNFTLSGRNDSLIEGEWDSTDVSISQLDGAELVIGGESVFRSGSAQVEVNRNNNQFMGPVSVLSGEDVSLYTASDIVLKGGDSLNAVRLHLEKSGDDGAVLQILEGNNAWTLSGANKGYITTDTITDSSDTTGFTFTGFTGLTGGSGQDTFTLLAGGSLTGAIEGGSGTSDRLSVIASEEQSLAWQLGADGDSSAITENGTARLGRFSGLEELIGSGEDTFTGRDQNTHWTLNAGITSDDNETSQPAWTVEEQGEGALNSFVLTGVSRLNGGDGSDTFTLGAGYGFAGTLDGGGGLDSLAVNVANDSTGGSVWRLHHDATAEGSEAVRTLNAQEGDDPVRLGGFDGMETLIGSGADRFYGRDRNTEWRQNEDDADEWFLTESTGDGGRYEGLKLLGMDELIGGSGNDTFHVASNVTDAYISLDGGSAGANTLNLSGTVSETLVQVGRIDETQETSTRSNWLINNILTITGSNDNVTLRMPSGDNDWTITNKNTGSLVQAEPADGGDDNRLFTGTLSFSGIANLIGGGGNDTFTFSRSGSNEGALAGGIDGGDGNNTLVGGDVDNVWTLTDQQATLAEASGDGETDPDPYLSGIANIQTLTGGSGDDSFGLSSLGSITTIIGAGGTNALSLTEGEQTWTLTDARSGTVSSLGFSAIHSITGSGSDTLRGVDQNNTWNLTGADAGTVALTPAEGDPAGESLSFEGMATLVGRGYSDQFILGDAVNFTGSVVGTADDDTAQTGAVDSVMIANGTNRWNLASIRSGSVVIPGTNTITRLQSFSGIDVLKGSGSDEIVAADGTNNTWTGGAVDEWTLAPADPEEEAAHTLTFSGMARLTGGSGDDTFSVGESTDVVTIDGGSGGHNTLTFSGTREPHVVVGEVSEEGRWSVARLTELNGSSDGTTTLELTAGANAWSVTGENAGEVSSSGDDALLDQAMSFGNVSHLVGGSGEDTFTFALGGSVASINGGPGEAEGNDTLVINSNPNDTVTWTLTGANSGTSVEREFVGSDGVETLTVVGEFSNIENLTGGDGRDEFKIKDEASLSGLLDGGAGNNNLDFSSWGEDGERALAIGFGTDGFGWNLKGINEVTGNGENSTLGLAYGDNTWNITTANGGSVTHQPGDNENALFSGDLTFNNFGNLTGGSGVDTFILKAAVEGAPAGSITGTIDGGEGTNALTVNGGPNQWYLDGRETGAVVGRGSADTVRVKAFTNILTLGSGDDTPNDHVLGRNANTDWVYGTGNQWTLFNEDDDESPLFVLTGMSQVTGGSGNDDFTVDAAANYIGEIDGGEGTNALTVNGGPNQWYLDGRETGAVVNRGNADPVRVKAFTNILSLGSGDDAPNDHVVGRNANTEWVYGTDNKWTLFNEDDDESPLFVLTGMTQVTGGTVRDDFTIEAEANYLGAIDGGEGTNALTVNGGPNQWYLDGRETGAVVARDNHDNVRLNSFTNLLEVKGGGTDVLVGRGEDSDWIYRSNDKWSLYEPNQTSNPLFVLTGMDKVTGGAGDDRFTLNADAHYLGTVDGGEGTNALTVNGGPNQWYLDGRETGAVVERGNADNVRLNAFTNILTLNGDEDNYLQGRDANTDWVYNTDNEWTLFNEGDGASALFVLIGMTQVTGGAGNDDFTLEDGASYSGKIDGGDGVNALTLNGGPNQWFLDGRETGAVVEQGNPSNVRLHAFTNILTLSGGDDAVQGRDANTDWVYNTDNEWTLFNEDDDASPLFVLTGMAQVTGGAGEDAFTLNSDASYAGTINGGGGANSLSVEGGPSQWYLDGRDNGAVVRLADDSVRLSAFQNIRELNGGGTDALLGRGEDTDWIYRRNDKWSLYEPDQTTSRLFVLTGMGSVTGGAGDDRFTLTSGAHYQGSVDGGDGRNALTVNSDSGTDVTWTLDGQSTGVVDNRLTGFSNIVTTNGGDGNDTFTLTSSAQMATINGGNGTDTVVYSFADDEGESDKASWTLTGYGAGTLQNASGQQSAFASIQSLIGSGYDDLTGPNLANHWRLSSEEGGSVGASGGAPEEALTFDGMANLTGGSQGDQFELTGDTVAFTGTIAGGSESGNRLTATQEGNQWRLTGTGTGNLENTLTFSAIQTLEGGTTGNTLAGPDRANRWTLSGANSGRVADADNTDSFTDFAGMYTLVGGAEADEFVVSGTGNLFAGMLNGGNAADNSTELDANDRVDLTARPASERITVGMDDARNADLNIVNIESIKANPDANVDDEGHRLIAPPEGTYQWTITGTNIGRVHPEGDARADNTLAFNGFAFLTGSENNVFAFEGGSLTGGVTGGSGSNFLDYSSSEDDICFSMIDAFAGCDGMSIEGINEIIGNHTGAGAPNATLRAEGDGDYIWSIQKLNELDSSDGVNDGIFDHGGEKEIRFVNFNHLVGGGGNDRFNFVDNGEITGSVDGGGVSGNGRNVVDTTGSNYGFAFWQTPPAGEKEADRTLWMKDIGEVTANTAYTNWLHGENSATTWTVTDTDSGYLGSEALLFQGVEHLVGGSGRDTFVIDVGGEVTGSISGGGNVNTLQVASQNDQDVDWQITGSQVGSVSNRVAEFTQVSELDGGDGDDTFTLNSTAQGVNIGGGNGDNRVAYQLTDNEGEAQAATWSLTGAYAGSIRTSSGDANTFENIQALSGSDYDTLTGQNVATRWLIASAEGGSVGPETQQSDRYLTFTGMAELQGGTAADYFSIIENGRQFTGSIDGGANGGNQLSATSADNDWLLTGTGTGSLNNALTFSNIQTLAGGGEGNTLTGPDRNNRWTLSGGQRGSVAEQGVSATTTNFTGMDTLVGGSLNDLFVASDDLTLNHLSGFVLIDGGAQPADGGDALDLTALSDEGDVAVALEANADAHIVIAGLETLAALGNNNQLYGASDQGYTWRIDALNSGTLSATATDSETPVSINFSGFANLTGGAASDTFAVVGDGSVDGQIEGGGGDGIDLVDYSGKSGAVDIVIGQANSDILGIEGVIGKSADGASTDVSRLRVANGETGKASWIIQRLASVASSDGVNDGRVAVGNNQTFYFINFNTLEGGQGGSEFILQGEGQLLGELIGDGGENTVATRNASVGHRFTLGERGEQDTRLVNIDSVTANLDRTHRLIGAVGDNTWRVTDEGAGEIDNRLTFAGIDHLIGGDGQNDFILSGNGVVGRIEGTGPTADNTLTIAERVDQPLTVSLDIESETADVRVSGLGELTGNSDGLRLEGDNRANLWVVDGDDSGTLNEAVAFSGFSRLLGNADTDRFELHGAGAVSGTIDGAGGVNTVDLFELTDGRVLNLATAEQAPGETPAADLVMLNINTLSAPTDAGHTLIGGASDNQWQIEGENRGTLGALSFSGVANLIGGDAADTIEFLLGGSLSGYIDGRGGENTVDMSELSGEVAVTVGDDAGDLRHITHFVGNNTQTTLRALRESNSWRLADGDNAGTLNTTLSFEQVTDLVGGAGVDTFRLQGGRVTGLMDGAGGNDQFLVNLETGARGSQALRGGDGNDELRVSGGDANYRVDYSPRTNGDEQLSYTAGNGRVFDLTFSQLEQVQDNVLAETLTINTRLNSDTVVANNNRVQVSDLSTLNYTNKTNLTLAANTDDVVELAGALTVPGRLEIRNAEVTQSTDDALIARDLRLVSINEFGTAGAPIKTDIETLDADVGTGGIALRNADALSVTALRSLGDAQLSARGNLTSDADLSVAGDARWVSEQAGVRLEGLNRFSNTVDLRAAHDVQLNHDGALLLGDVQAKTFGLDNRGDVNQAEGEWTIDLLDLSVSGDVMAANDDNRIQGLRANSVGNLTLASDEALRLDGIDSDGNVIIRGRGLSVENRLAARDVNLDARGGSLTVNRSVTADAIALSGERVVQNAELNSGGRLAINAGDDLEQNARLAAVADIQLEAGGELTMSRSARTESEGGTIEYAAGGDLTVSYIDNSTGTVALHSDGRIQSALDEQTVGLTAQRIELAARDGIGAEQTLALNTRELHATNNRGRIDLHNTGEVRIERLANNDDIVLVNQGTVTLDNRERPVFDRTADDAVDAGGVTNANYEIGTVRFTVENGNLLALGPVDGTRPDLVGRRGLFLVNGDIGSLARPLVMYFQESLIFQALRSWQPIWAFNDAPDTFENNSVVKMGNEGLMGAGEQLVEVESLEDIDPAIFTAVRNYSFDDVSILLPPDQRYSDDDDEDERYSAY